MNEKQYARDFTDVRKATLVETWFDEGLKITILSLRSHFTAYIGIHLSHPLAGKSYDDLPINAHGGLTYSNEGDDEPLEKGYWWYGWDYAHAGDYHYPGEDMIEKYKEEGLFQKRDDEKDWTLKEVKSDSWEPIYEMKKLMKLAEDITNKAKK